MNNRAWQFAVVWAAVCSGGACVVFAQQVRPNVPVAIETEAADANRPAPAPPSALPVRPPRPVRAADLEPPLAPPRPAASSLGVTDKSTPVDASLPARMRSADSPDAVSASRPAVHSASAAPVTADSPQTADDSREQLPLGRNASRSLTGTAPIRSDSAWVWQTLGALAIVIALIFLLRTLVKRLSGQRSLGDPGGLVEMLARCTISPKTQVLFLKLQQRILVVAQSPAGLQTLTCIDDPEEVAQLLASIDASRPNSLSRNFRQLIHRMDRGYREADEHDATRSGRFELALDRTREQVSGLLGRLRRMNTDK